MHAKYCGAIKIAPDATGVVYLASHSSRNGLVGSALADPLATSLWWQVWDVGLPPVQLCSSAVSGRILGFGWAPSTEDEEHITENENGEEESEILPGLRLWVTTLRPGCARPHTQLLDLQGSILGAFELPITHHAIHWLQDGRRVMVTESLQWLPALWDGAALSPLPVQKGFSQVHAQFLAWPGVEGAPLPAVCFSLHSTVATAPLVLLLHDERDPTPLVGCRSAAAHSPFPPLPALLRLGCRVVAVECPPPSASRTRRMIIDDLLYGLERFQSSSTQPAKVVVRRGPLLPA